MNQNQSFQFDFVPSEEFKKELIELESAVLRHPNQAYRTARNLVEWSGKDVIAERWDKRYTRSDKGKKKGERYIQLYDVLRHPHFEDFLRKYSILGTADGIMSEGNTWIHNNSFADYDLLCKRAVICLGYLHKYFVSYYKEFYPDELSSVVKPFAKEQVIRYTAIPEEEYAKLIQENIKLQVDLEEKEKATAKFVSEPKNDRKEFESDSEVKLISVGITEGQGRIWSKMFLNFEINNQLYHVLRFYSNQITGKATKYLHIIKGDYRNNTLFESCPSDGRFTFDNIDEVKSEVYDKQFYLTPDVDNFERFRNDLEPSVALNDIIEFIKERHVSKAVNDKLFDLTVSPSQLYSKGAVEKGVHGIEKYGNEYYASHFHLKTKIAKGDMKTMLERISAMDLYNRAKVENDDFNEWPEVKYENDNYTIKKYRFSWLENIITE